MSPFWPATPQKQAREAMFVRKAQVDLKQDVPHVQGRNGANRISKVIGAFSCFFCVVGESFGGRNLYVCGPLDSLTPGCTIPVMC